MNTSDILVKHNIRPSIIRVMIYDYLREHPVHPTADEVYDKLSSKIPTLSKTTVYNTLNLFVKEGVIITVNIDSTKVRFDADTNIHGHFLCSKCEKVYDFKVNSEFLNDPEGFEVHSKDVYYTGICPYCK